ncbi:bifunctional riboflavin kinase/FAD synthetase [Endothiovibrio diazotrophicus]
MELIRGLHNLRPRHRGCVATIGNFDGVHLGHQAVLGQLADHADALGLPMTVVAFEPQPQEFFAPDKAPPRLTKMREKVKALRRFSVERTLLLPFNRALAAMSPDQFVQRLLVEGLGVKYLVVGDDFRFGAGRKGDFALLHALGRQHGFQVAHMHTFLIEDRRVSSTRIRTALAAGDLGEAQKLLGRPYRMCGRIAHGDKRGRTIGFPTANIFLHRIATPLTGVYAIEMFGLDEEPVQGVANLGSRPTVDGFKTLLEVHLFDFDQQIYGRHVQVDFLHKIRDERKFPSFDDLKNQILLDVEQARGYFA